MPFTAEQFFEIFAAWNNAIWPFQWFAYALGVLALLLLFRRKRYSTRYILLILASMWIVNGVGYHWMFFSRINPLAWLFAVAFLLQAFLLLSFAMLGLRIRIVPTWDMRTLTGLGLALYAMLIYPLLGQALGHVFPAAPAFGVAPCPTTIFTIGLLLLGSWRTSRWLLLIPAIWGIVGGSAAILLGLPQDYGLLVAVAAAGCVAIVEGLGAGCARHVPDPN